MPNTSIQTSASSIHMKNWFQDMVRGCLATALLFYFTLNGIFGAESEEGKSWEKSLTQDACSDLDSCVSAGLWCCSVWLWAHWRLSLAALCLCGWLKLCNSFFHPDKPTSLRDTDKQIILMLVTWGSSVMSGSREECFLFGIHARVVTLKRRIFMQIWV